VGLRCAADAAMRAPHGAACRPAPGGALTRARRAAAADRSRRNQQHGIVSAGSGAANSLVSNSDALSVYDVMGATGELVESVAGGSADAGALIDACTRVYAAEARALRLLGSGAAAVEGLEAAAERVRQQAELSKQQLAGGNLPAAVLGLYLAVFIDAVEDLKHAVVGSSGRGSLVPGSLAVGRQQAGADQRRRAAPSSAAAAAAQGAAQQQQQQQQPVPWPLSLLFPGASRRQAAAAASPQPASV